MDLIWYIEKLKYKKKQDAKFNMFGKIQNNDNKKVKLEQEFGKVKHTKNEI